MNLTTLGRRAKISKNEVQQSLFQNTKPHSKTSKEVEFYNIIMTKSVEKLKKAFQETCYFSGKFLILVTQDYSGSNHLLKHVLY